MYSVVVPQVSSSGTSDASNKSIASSSGGGGMGYQVFKKGIQNLDKFFGQTKNQQILGKLLYFVKKLGMILDNNAWKIEVISKFASELLSLNSKQSETLRWFLTLNRDFKCQIWRQSVCEITKYNNFFRIQGILQLHGLHWYRFKSPY